MTKANRILAEPKRFTGKIRVGGEDHDIKFYATTNDRHELELKFEPMDLETTKAHWGFPGRTGECVEWHPIAGSSKDEWRFFTNKFEVSRIDPASRSLSGVAHEAFVFSPEHKSELLGLERWIRGFHSWDGTRIKTRLGNAGVEASAWNEDRQLVSARVAVISDHPPCQTNWGVAARDYLNYVCAGLSFVDGGWLKYPVERFSTPSGSFWRFLAVASSPREFPPEHALNNSEMLKTLFESYFRDPRPKDRFWDAVSWMYLPTSNNEGRFIGAMTAIEFWLSLEFDADRDFSHMPADEFEKVVRSLVENLKQAHVPQPLLDGAEARLRPLRQFSLKKKILQAFKFRGISLADVSEDDLLTMIGHRNKLVHEGRWLDGVSWEMVFLARELVTRIVLHTIGFKGSYDSYLGGNGSHRRTFPDCRRNA